MVGAPGAGKGTQAALLAERLGVPHAASGDLFRDNIKRETALGKTVKNYIDRGALVPDDMTVQMISDRLSQKDAANGAILDGFPRTRPQAQALDRMLDRLDGRVAAALYIDVDREELIRRLSGRWLCSAASDHVYHDTARPPKKPGKCDVDGAALYQRDDDKPETIRARLEQQLPPMYDVIDYYTDRGVLSAVRGDRPVPEVTEELLHAIAQQTHASNGRTLAEPPGAERSARSSRTTGSRVADRGPAKEGVRRGARR
ncbi:MAG: adenylate kinase [Candidatus Limnocylindrales bacterium]